MPYDPDSTIPQTPSPSILLPSALPIAALDHSHIYPRNIAVHLSYTHCLRRLVLGVDSAAGGGVLVGGGGRVEARYFAR